MTIQSAKPRQRNDIFYELPDREGLLRVLDAVPHWAYVSGRLENERIIGGEI